MKAFLIDDESDARSTLRTYLTKYCPDVTVAGEADNLTTAVRGIRDLQPDVVFLDITLNAESGFELFDSPDLPSFLTIFTTAYQEYAVNAIQTEASGYLLKPISIEELLRAVARAKKLLEKENSLSEYRDLKAFLKKTKPVEKLPLPVLDGFVYIDIHDIVRCEADNSYTIFHFASRGKITVCKTLGHYQELLKDKGFFRVHNHHLINLAFITRYQRGRGGSVFLADGSEIVVSQRKRDEFLATLTGFYPGG